MTLIMQPIGDEGTASHEPGHANGNGNGNGSVIRGAGHDSSVPLSLLEELLQDGSLDERRASNQLASTSTIAPDHPSRQSAAPRRPPGPAPPPAGSPAPASPLSSSPAAASAASTLQNLRMPKQQNGPVLMRPGAAPAASRQVAASPAAVDAATPVTPALTPPALRPLDSEAGKALYAGSTVAADLSSVDGGVDVLQPQLDALQLLPPFSDSAGNATRVYSSAKAAAAAAAAAAADAKRKRKGAKAGAAAAAAAAATAGAASAPPLKVGRAKARKLLNASELMLARDEAVRAELLGQTWKELLKPEVLDHAKHLQHQQALEQQRPLVEDGARAPAAAVPSRARRRAAAQGKVRVVLAPEPLPVEQVMSAQPLSQVLASLEGLTQQLRAERQQQQQAEAEAGSPAKAAGPSREQQRQLLVSILSKRRWRTVEELLERQGALLERQGAHLGPAHYVATLWRLVQLYPAIASRAEGEDEAVLQGVRQERLLCRAAMERAVQRVVFCAPEMSGRQAAHAVMAMSRMPQGSARSMLATLQAVQKMLIYGRHNWDVQPASPPTPTNPQRAGATASPEPAAAAVEGSDAHAAPPAPSTSGVSHGAMRPLDFAKLAFFLGSLNQAACPLRVSLRVAPAVRRALLLGSYARMPVYDASELATMIAGLANVPAMAPPTPWLRAFYVASARALPAMSVQELTMVAYGVARMPAAGKPPAAWIQVLLGQVASRFGELDGAALALLAHSLGRLKFKPPRPWLDAFLAAAEPRLDAMRGEELSSLARGLAFLGFTPSPSWTRALLLACGRAMDRGQLQGAQLANTAWALGLLKVTPPRKWLDVLLARLEAQAKGAAGLRPRHARRALEALSAFGVPNLQRWCGLLKLPLDQIPGYRRQQALAAAKQARQAKAAAAAPDGVLPSSAKVQAEATAAAVAAVAAAPQGERRTKRRKRGSRAAEATAPTLLQLQPLHPAAAVNGNGNGAKAASSPTAAPERATARAVRA